MEKKFERVFRSDPLTPEEIKRDTEVRKLVEQDFPPKRRDPVGRSALTELLKQSIRNSSKSVEEIAQDAHVPPVLITRFLAGEADIHVATADRLADALGLKIAFQR